jgi:hypothetical protein
MIAHEKRRQLSRFGIHAVATLPQGPLWIDMCGLVTNKEFAVCDNLDPSHALFIQGARRAGNTPASWIIVER